MDSTSLLIASFQKGASGEVIASLYVCGSPMVMKLIKSGPKFFGFLILLPLLGSISFSSTFRVDGSSRVL